MLTEQLHDTKNRSKKTNKPLNSGQTKAAFTARWERKCRHFCFRRFFTFWSQIAFPRHFLSLGSSLEPPSSLEILFSQALFGVFIFFHKTVSIDAEIKFLPGLRAALLSYQHDWVELHDLPPSKAACSAGSSYPPTKHEEECQAQVLSWK